VPRLLVHQLLEHSADTRPNAEFVVTPDARCSYANIEAEANRIANLLIGLGVEAGDRVALLARKSPLYVASYYGVLKARGVVVPLSNASSATSVADYVSDCGAQGLIVGPGLERIVQRAGDRLDGLGWLLSPNAERLTSVDTQRIAWDASGPAQRPGLDVDSNELACIVYTSGTTGRPRGAMLSHANIAANTAAIVDYLELAHTDRALLVLPLSYVYGMSVLNTHAQVGGCVVVESRFQYPNIALDTLEAEACTGFAGVPSSFAILLNRSTFLDRPLPSLRYLTQAGGAMSPAMTRRLMAATNSARIFIMYGATEAAARLAYLAPEQLPQRLGSIGRAIAGVDLRVVGDDGQECAADHVGELVARGPNIMRGYWNAPQETAEVLDAAGYHTGDLARRDNDGFLYIVGRSRDMLKVGGHRIAAREIEDTISEHEAVHEVAVIGEPDELLGAKLRAFVVLRGGHLADAKELSKFLAERLPGFKVPKLWDFVDALPKNEAGKVVKMELG